MVRKDVVQRIRGHCQVTVAIGDIPLFFFFFFFFFFFKIGCMGEQRRVDGGVERCDAMEIDRFGMREVPNIAGGRQRWM
jgi:hypothetical protein